MKIRAVETLRADAGRRMFAFRQMVMESGVIGAGRGGQDRRAVERVISRLRVITRRRSAISAAMPPALSPRARHRAAAARSGLVPMGPAPTARSSLWWGAGSPNASQPRQWRRCVKSTVRGPGSGAIPAP
jgi:hypothetical protein